MMKFLFLDIIDIYIKNYGEESKKGMGGCHQSDDR